MPLAGVRLGGVCIGGDTKTLLIDVETYPHLVWVWDVWDQNVAPSQIERRGGILCFASKWLGRRGTEFRSIKKDGRAAMIRRIHALLNEADAVISYNGQRFDIPRLEQEFFLAKMKPPAPFAHIDLYKTAKRFKLPHSKFETLLNVTGHGGKVEHEGFRLWRKCMGGPWYPGIERTAPSTYERAWRTMERYNKTDTEKMEPLYRDMLPWIKNHPNVNLYAGRRFDRERPRCPTCGGTRVNVSKYKVAKTRRYTQWQCQNSKCGQYFSDTKAAA